jgi:signal transduction histidine kinase
MVFAIAIGVAAGTLAWITNHLVESDRAEQQAHAAAQHQESLRLALWRMDSWLSTAVALETKGTGRWMAGANASPRPMTQLVKQYVRIDPGTPLGDDLSALRDHRAVWKRIDRGLARLGSELPRPIDEKDPAPDTYSRNEQEYKSRASQNVQAQTVATEAHRSILVPMWVRQDGADLLVYLRHDVAGRSASGFVVDWAYVHGSLTALVADVLPGATLRPLSDDEVEHAAGGFVMAAAPIELDAPRPPAPRIPLTTSTSLTIVVAWSALAFAFAAVGVALRRTADLSDRRSRFASSVTHELRTPLTTFRLYSEMLADGMVTDGAKRQEYLDTLKSESARLAALVENVLAYARVEEGRMPVRRERISVADLLLRVTPPLDRRAQDGGATLTVETGSAAPVVVDCDPAVVGQILFNLVDNAAKYAPRGAIELTAESRGGVVRLAVRDHGPGLAADKVRAAFTPFERAGRPAGDVIPGIGLGLALSRALARDLGGDLDHETPPGGGAAFVLTLPTAG